METNGDQKEERATRAVRPASAAKKVVAKKAPRQRTKLDIRDNDTTLAGAELDALPSPFATTLTFAEAIGAVVLLKKGRNDDDTKDMAFISIVRADGRPV